MKKATRQQTRSHNTRLVLKTILEHGNVSRADIARITRLTRPTVSAIVADLQEENLVVETGVGPSAGGKPPILLNIDVDSHRLLCIDLGNQEFRGALVNMQGEITRRIHFPSAGHRGEEALHLVYRLVEALLAAGTARILGIGIGTPGLIDPQTGLVHHAVNLGWEDLPLSTLLDSRYRLPIYLANDSHLAALGEYTYGEPQAGSNLIVIKIGQGIGAGIVLGGKLFYGDTYNAGEIGHVVVQEQGELCRCGNRGCLETVASTRAILQAAQQAGFPDWEALTAAAIRDEDQARQIVTAAGRHLGVALAHLVGSLNINHIILSGRVEQLGNLLLEAAADEVRRRVLPAMGANMTLEFSHLGTDIVVLGASALVLQQELGVI